MGCAASRTSIIEPFLRFTSLRIVHVFDTCGGGAGPRGKKALPASGRMPSR